LLLAKTPRLVLVVVAMAIGIGAPASAAPNGDRSRRGLIGRGGQAHLEIRPAGARGRRRRRVLVGRNVLGWPRSAGTGTRFTLALEPSDKLTDLSVRAAGKRLVLLLSS
jgi:hypothetical protein